MTPDTPAVRAEPTKGLELLPCPFCGEAAEEALGKHGDDSPWHYIECPRCGAATEPEVWNTRIDPRELASQVKVLREALENARRDLNGICPRSDTGSRRKRIIEEAIARVERALAATALGKGE